MGTPDRLRRAIEALVPSGVGRLLRRHRLRRRHGLVSLGSEFEHHISSDSTFGFGCRLGGPVYIGGSAIGAYTYIEVGSRISLADVGRYCSIAPYVLVGLAEHPTRKNVSTHPMFYRRMPAFGYDLVDRDRHRELTRTRVGNDVWIGAGACIRSGLTIGDGAIIGAGAVVTSDVPPYAIYGGVPARLIRYRFDPSVIDALLELRWWDRDIGWLRAHIEDMQDVDALLHRVEKLATKGGP